MILATTFLAAAMAQAPALPLRPCSIQTVRARCGTLAVPENRAKPDGKKIGLDVVVIPARAAHPARDAMAYLAGGPGGAATASAYTAVSMWRGLNETRDILLVDQRGTGQSNPLDCAPPKVAPKTGARIRAWVDACLASLHSDLTQYGTRDAMADVEAVRKALGYETLDLYGGSYGATAAQVFLKMFPHSVRSVVLDGATELDVPFYSRFAVNAQHALDDVARRCNADASCKGRYPGWRTTFSKLVRAWDAHPVTTAPHVKTTGVGLAGIVQGMLLNAADAASIPLLVRDAARHDYRVLNGNITSGSNPPMYWTIWCNEPWVGISAKGPWHTDFDGYAATSIAAARKVCAYVPKHREPASAWTMPHSNVPVLVLAGGADPQDPIGNMPRLKQVFPNSRALVLPGFGHTVAQYGCLGTVVSVFVTTAKVRGLDTSCVDVLQPPAFTSP